MGIPGDCGIYLVRDTFQDPIPACDDFRSRQDGIAAAAENGTTDTGSDHPPSAKD